jgi:predicted secreted protein
MKKLLSIIFLFVLLSSCSYKQATKESPAENEFNIGEPFRITLPENHTTGYMWQINNNYDSKILDYYGSVFHGNEKGVDFNFKTLAQGKSTVNFALIKYQDTLEIKQFVINVK